MNDSAPEREQAALPSSGMSNLQAMLCAKGSRFRQYMRVRELARNAVVQADNDPLPETPGIAEFDQV